MELVVYWTQFAEDKLGDLFDYYELKASYRIARKLVTGIVDKTIGLKKIHILDKKKNSFQTDLKILDT